MRHIYIILAGLLLTACNGEKWCAKHYPPEIISRVDSFTQVEYRDTVVFVDGPVLRDTFRVECDSTGQIVITGGNGTIQYVYRDRWLSLAADCPDTAIVIPRYKQVVKVAKSRQDVVKVPDMYIPWWAEILSYIGGFSLLYVAGRSGWRYFMQSV